jgi:hypothetical protein
MDPEEIINPEGQPDGSQLNPADPAGTVSNVAAEGLTLSELNATLGKNFPTKEAALKSFKDTYSYVGKKVDDIKREVLSDVKNDDRLNQLANELAEERKERFYDRNPNYASLRSVIEKMGTSPAEVVNTAEFKEIYEKISGYDESQKLKTVLESNPRLSSSRDSLTKAREIVRGQQDGQPTEEASQLVVNAVKDAFGL